MFQRAIDLEVSPRVNAGSELVGSVMFTNQRVEKFDSREPELLDDLARNPRVQQIRGKIRTPTDAGKPVPKMKASKIRLTIVHALACPAIRSIGVHLDKVSPPEYFQPAKANTESVRGPRPNTRNVQSQ